MKTRIIRIGKSQGVRIPKPLLKQAHLGDEVELRVEGNSIIISSVALPRMGLEEAFRPTAVEGEDVLVDMEVRDF